jgi:hypothetical protein
MYSKNISEKDLVYLLSTGQILAKKSLYHTLSLDRQGTLIDFSNDKIYGNDD